MRRDGGVVAILTAILMLVFLGMCAFAVDVGHWYLVREQTQKAADAAALAAVVNLPDDVTNARATAKQFAALNGFTEATGTSVTANTVVGDPGRLTVTVSTTVANYFAGLFGVGTTTISSTGQAAYVGSVKMGSPCNRLGSDPDNTAGANSSTCGAAAGRLWANIGSPNMQKQDGDPFATKVCAGFEDRCTGTTNTEYTPNGYLYDIQLKQATTLTVELFDAPWVDVGGTSCSSAPMQGLKTLTEGSTRYAFGADSPYCTGDGFHTGTRVGSAVETTTFTLRSPSGDAMAPETHPILCQRIFGGYAPTSAQEFHDRLDPSSGTYDATLFRTFRKWKTLCTVPNAAAGTYILQVQSTGAVSASNAFSIRATGTDLTKVTVSGHGYMGLFANDTRPNSTFYLARVPSSAAGQTLHAKFFDVGDCDGVCTLTVLKPGTGAAATGCQGTSGSAVVITGCSFQAVNLNGRWADLLVPIPAGYDCNDSDPTACWYRVQYSGGTPHDATTWTAAMDGQPVRIVP